MEKRKKIIRFLDMLYVELKIDENILNLVTFKLPLQNE